MRRAHCSTSFSRPVPGCALPLSMASLKPARVSFLATAFTAALLLASLSSTPAHAQTAPITEPVTAPNTAASTAANSPSQSSQPSPPSASAQVLNPAAATLPLTSPALPVSTAVAQEITDWRAANAAVAEFKRGHTDVVKWEKLQTRKASNTQQQQHQPAASRPAPHPATQPVPAEHHHGAAQ